jgi:hypothetical protein
LHSSEKLIDNEKDSFEETFDTAFEILNAASRKWRIRID